MFEPRRVTCPDRLSIWVGFQCFITRLLSAASTVSDYKQSGCSNLPLTEKVSGKRKQQRVLREKLCRWKKEISTRTLIQPTTSRSLARLVHKICHCQPCQSPTGYVTSRWFCRVILWIGFCCSACRDKKALIAGSLYRCIVCICNAG